MEDPHEKHKEEQHEKHKEDLQEIALTAPTTTVVTPQPDSLTTDHDEEEEQAKKQQSVMVQSADMERLLNDYKKFCKKQNPPIDVKDDQLKPDDEGRVTLDFGTPEQMTDFFKQQAENGNRFVMIDAETNKVLAYSNGDGKLYRPGLGKDKEPEEITGKSLLPTKEQMKDLPDHKDFKMPEPAGPKVENK
ncbi:hypothetical protein [Legionella longbeachae]|uniref:Dot/Icm secretion system substrate n=1 Tax=Legionella longbeachae serogroup 1 (strain NSW150) TaxID=661367 RepID=D3HNK4_LEGLN|nr:hypothetical protein [Legionella longbeachae]VEE00994.1 Dot/Icm secretion system substrate [Legionella oakridgensis]HBD7399269.1 hypothetical protein [Legionella pneumophila]ARB92624.1 hypothetical protein A6J40_10740 [Legionella longbeachae]ARM34201.1 hypothetical protein B0B39_11985 [Legionella longbeachae]EEZ96539.1 conserved hypothetical protein [Legionella longbeachae D-4968]